METGGIRILGLQEFRFALGFRIWGLGTLNLQLQVQGFRIRGLRFGAEGLLWGVQIRSSGRTKALNPKSEGSGLGLRIPG